MNDLTQAEQATNSQAESDSLDALEAQQLELSRRIAERKKQMRGEALARVRQDVARFDLTADEIFAGNNKASKKREPVSPKFRDPATGATWTGRGRTPLWLQGQNKDDFAIV